MIARVCRAAHLTVADSRSVVWVLRASGQPVPERVASIDVIARLLLAAAEHRLRVYFLGARRDVVTALVETTRVRHPGIEIATFRDGYFGSHIDPSIVEEIRANRADMCSLVCPPRSRRPGASAIDNASRCPSSWESGGSFDVLAGFIMRAPRWAQPLGLEWFWQLMMELRKLWRRYLTTNIEFILLAGREIIGRRLGRPPATQAHM